MQILKQNKSKELWMSISYKSFAVRLTAILLALIIFCFGCTNSADTGEEIDLGETPATLGDTVISTGASEVASETVVAENSKMPDGVPSTLSSIPLNELSTGVENSSVGSQKSSDSDATSSNLWDGIACAHTEDYEKTRTERYSARSQLYYFGGDINLTDGGKYGEWDKAVRVDFHPIMVSEGVVPRDIFETINLYLELRDIDDNFLKKIPVETVPPPRSEDPGPYTFLAEFINLPWEDDISQKYHKISLVDNSDSESPRVIDFISRSNNMPVANTILPIAGQTVTGETFSLVWSGNDVDGDELTYRTWYSIDNGNTYQVIDSWLDTTTRELNLHSFPRFESNTAKFAVSVSDGAQSAFVESPTFCVPQIIPQFFALNVDDETVLSRSLYNDQTIILGVTGNSELAEEYGTITFDWHSDRVGFLGKGISMLLSSTTIGVGNHTITATGKMSNGEEVTVSAKINVFNF